MLFFIHINIYFFCDLFLDTFNWEEYLKEASSIPAPPTCFRQVGPLGFFLGDFLEDRSNLIL